MVDVRDLPEAIQWHEGMLLGPQHFQQLSLRHEELVHYHAMAVSPFHWGLRRMSVDHLLLADGTLRVLSLEAIMPDGLIVCFDQRDNDRLEVDLTSHVEEMHHKPLTIHLVVPVRTDSRAATEGGQPRYDSVEGRPVVDVNTGESALSIPSLRPRLSLLVSPTLPGKYTGFPLLKVIYKDDAFNLDPFIAPTLNVVSDSPLWDICSTVGQKIRGRAFSLSEKVHSPAVMARETYILETRLMIQAMVSSLPRFEAVLHSNRSHPFLLYLVLCQMAGNMAALGTGLVPPVFSEYNHNDLRATYMEVIQYINRMMDEGVSETHTPIPFVYQNGVFSIKLTPARSSARLLIGARLKPGTSEQGISDWMDECLIGSDPNIDQMRMKRILGPERKQVQEEGGLIPPRGITLFSVKNDPRFIEVDQELMVINISDTKGRRAPAELLLYVRNQALNDAEERIRS